MKGLLTALALVFAPILARAEIYDHLMRCDTEAACQADPVIGKYWAAPSADDPTGHWRGDVVIPNVSVYAITGTTTVTNPDGSTSQVPVKTAYPGWFAVIALPTPDLALEGATNGACRLVADRDAAEAGNPNFIVYLATDVTPVDLSAAHVEPTFAGSKYPFGSP